MDPETITKSLTNDICKLLNIYNKKKSKSLKISTQALSRLKSYIVILIKCIILHIYIMDKQRTLYFDVYHIINLVIDGINFNEIINRETDIYRLSSSFLNKNIANNKIFLNILGFDYSFSTCHNLNLMELHAESIGITLRDEWRHLILRFVENILLYIFDNTTSDTIKLETLQNFSKQEIFRNIDISIGNKNFLGLE